MKYRVVNSCINLVKKYRDLTSEEEAVIKYGLEGIYLTVTKTFVILLISLIMGYLKESIIFMVIYGILRTFSFGIHASKSIYCWISSILLFDILPIIASYINIINNYKLIIGILGIILIYTFSPADTYKRPIVNKFRRRKLKIISTIIAAFYLVLSIVINNNFISNSLIISIVLQNILISPLTYKLFKLPYNNYISYLKKNPDLNNLN